MPDEDTFLTITEARRIIAAVTGKATGSLILDRAQGAEAPPADLHGADREPLPTPAPASQDGTVSAVSAPEAQHAAEPEAAPMPDLGDEQEPQAAPTSTASPTPASAPPRAAASASASVPRPAAPPHPARLARVPVFVMETTDGQQGILGTTDRPEAEGRTFLDVEEAGRIEVAFAELRCVSTR